MLQGSKRKFAHEYPCHSPTRERWFLMTAMPLPRAKPRQVVVTHVDITAHYHAQLRMADKQHALDVALSQLRDMVTQIKEGLAPATGAQTAPAPLVTPSGKRPDFLKLLSAREREVFAALVRGERNATIADRLALSPKSVSTYRARIFDKLDVASLAELVSLAERPRWL